MNFREHVEKLDNQLGHKLHEVETSLIDEKTKKPVKVYFYLANMSDGLDSLHLANTQRYTESGLDIALTRARDEEGKLLWPDDNARKEALENLRYRDLISDMGFKIANVERKILGDNLASEAEKN